MLNKRTMAEKKKSNIGKGILQFVIFIIVLGVSTVIAEKTLFWIVLIVLSFLWYCFIGKDDKNLFFDKEAIVKRFKSSKARRIWFIALSIIFGYAALGNYQWEYQEQVQDAVNNVNENLEDFNEWLDDSLNDLANEAGQLEL